VSPPPEEYKVGYKRPPKHSRWKKGQSGNPNKRRPPREVSDLQAIDALLLRPIAIVEDGEAKRVTALEVIVLQLWQKEIAGSSRALSARLKFEAIARDSASRGIEIELIDSDYTRSLSSRKSRGRK
jgi:hypothetical protein